MEQTISDSFLAYLLDPNSIWIVVGYTLLSFVSSVALYDFGILQTSKKSKFKIVFIHYTSIAFLFALTALLLEISNHGYNLKAVVNFLFLLIKLFIAFFSSSIIYKIFKDYLFAWALKKLRDFTNG